MSIEVDVVSLPDVMVEVATHVIDVEVSGSPGPQGPTGQGVLVLNMGDPVPPGTPDNTVIFRKEP